MWGFAGVVLVVVTVALLRSAHKSARSDSNYNGWTEDSVMVRVGLATVTGLFALWFLIGGLGEAWTYSMNPDWATIKLITSAIK